MWQTGSAMKFSGNIEQFRASFHLNLLLLYVGTVAELALL